MVTEHLIIKNLTESLRYKRGNRQAEEVVLGEEEEAVGGAEDADAEELLEEDAEDVRLRRREEVRHFTRECTGPPPPDAWLRRGAAAGDCPCGGAAGTIRGGRSLTRRTSRRRQTARRAASRCAPRTAATAAPTRCRAA